MPRPSLRAFVAQLGGPLPRDPELRRRHTLVLVVTLALLLNAVPLLVQNWWHLGHLGVTGVTFSLGIPLMFGNIVALRRGVRPERVGALVTVELQLTLTVLIYANGGLRSAATLWALTVPLLGCLMVGGRAAGASLAALLMELVAFYVAELAGVIFPQPLSDTQMELWHLLGLSTVAIFLAATVIAYERSRILASEEREVLQRQLLELARDAGMAQVATGVLHDVGNALNGVHTSAGVIHDGVRGARIAGVRKLADLLERHRHDWSELFGPGGRGDKLPAYVAGLADELEQGQARLLEDLAQLRLAADHAADVVRSQQRIAKRSKTVTECDLASLVDEAVTVGSAGRRREVRLDLTPCALVTDGHRVVQILVNLVANAHDALDEAGRTAPVRITSRVDDGCVAIAVHDQGVGFAPAQQARLFAHGFTTKADGHGFGLHASANAATELGGSLTADSPGPGRGATFTLRIPA